jgi:hypothetical protein
MKSSAIVTRSAVVMFLAAAPLPIAGKTPTINTYPLGNGAGGASGIAKEI